MEFSTLIWERCSVRKYSAQPVEEEKLQRVLEAAQAAPTAVNYQPQRILVLRSREAQEKLAKLHEVSLWPAADAAHLLRQPGKLEARL